MSEYKYDEDALKVVASLKEDGEMVEKEEDEAIKIFETFFNAFKSYTQKTVEGDDRGVL